MAFATRMFETADLRGSTIKKKSTRSDSEPKEYTSVRLNSELTIGKAAKTGTAKEILVVPVGMFRAPTQFGATHALKCIDPECGEEGILFLNTKLAEYTEANGTVKHFVAGNFDGNVLTTFGVRVSASVDGGYGGEYTECDGEWEFDPEFYGKPVYLIRKAIPKKNGKGTYQVLEWRFCEDREFPDLQTHLEAYEEREEERVAAAEEAAQPAKAPPKTTEASKSKKATKPKQQKKPAPVKQVEQVGQAGPSAEEYAREQIEANTKPGTIVQELKVLYDLSEEEAITLIDVITEEGDEEEKDSADPVYARALALFRGGTPLAGISVTLGDEFKGISAQKKLDVIKKVKGK